MRTPLAVFCAVIAAGWVSAGELEAFTGKAYPLSTCVVSGEPLGSMGEPVQVVVEGRDVRLCCAGCTKKLQGDTAVYLGKIDEAIVAQQQPHYAMTTCPISGEDLGSMGEPISKIAGNQLIQLCCAGCEKKLAADPAAAIAKADAAIVAKEKESYPFDKCVVTGETLGGHGDPVDVVEGGRLVRLCCASCKAKLQATPFTYLQMLESGKLATPDAEGSDHKSEEHAH